MLSSRRIAAAAHLALLCCFSHASDVIFSTRVRADVGRKRSSPRAIPSPSSLSQSPGSFMIQMPFTVVSDPSKLVKDSSTPVIERIEPSGPTLMSLGENGEKINFYTIKCREGVACSSIIPAQIVQQESTSEKPRSVEEVKRYLKSLNLENGFGFNKPGGKPDIAASYFEEDNNERKSKHVLFRDIRDYEDFWPGSHLRPKEKFYSVREEKRSRPESSNDGRAYHDPTLLGRLKKQLPSQLHIIAPVNLFPGRISQARKFSSQIPSPVFSNALEWPYASDEELSKKTLSSLTGQVSGSITVNEKNKGLQQNSKRKYFTNEGKSDGWSRFATSTVAQLDKKTGDWHKISSSSSKIVETPALYKPPVYRPENLYSKRPYPPVGANSGGLDSTYKHTTSTGLTVLGVTESNTPTSSVEPMITTSSDDHLNSFPPTPWSSSTVHSIDPRPANDSQNKQKPLQPISASTHVSYPLYVLPAESSTSLNVVSNSTKNETDSSKTRITSSTTTTTTRTTRRPTTTTTRPPQSGGGGGGGGGGFLGGNPYAVMAAVGAGLIPATFAALLPVFVGRRRRRRSVNWFDDEGSPAPDSPFSTDLLTFLSHQRLPPLRVVRKR